MAERYHGQRDGRVEVTARGVTTDVDTEGDGQTPADVDLDPGVQLLVGEDELHHDTEPDKEQQGCAKEFG